jgi:phosphate transport system permease protein
MPLLWLLLIVLAIAVIGYVMGRQRAIASGGGDARVLHSLPSYYGANVALTVLTPAIGLLALWMLVQPAWIERQVTGLIPDEAIVEGSSRDFRRAVCCGQKRRFVRRRSGVNQHG